MSTPNSPTMKFVKLYNVHTFKCTQRKQNNWNPCVFMHCALCIMHLKTIMSCAQCWHQIVNMCSMLIPNLHIMQSVHIIRCIQKKQSSWNPSMSMHYALKDSNELCTMLMSRNEHECNINPKLTHNAQWQCQVL